MSTTSPATAVGTDKEVLPPANEKELARPIDNTDKQAIDPFQDPSDDVRPIDEDIDTSKQAIPNLPPVSTDKQVAQPHNNTDKQTALGSDFDKEIATPSSATATSSSSNAPCLKFRVEKYNALGLIMPQNQRHLFRSIDPSTDVDIGPAFVTNDMHWIDILSALPPAFELFSAHEEGQSALVSRALPRGWQGISSCKVDMEVDAPRPDSSIGDRLKVLRQKWTVERTGMGRTYRLKSTDVEASPEFFWKGSTKAIKDMKKQAKEEGKEAKRVHKGNLKLTTKDGEVLALWVQTRDMDVLGDMVIYESAKSKVAAEVIITSGLAVISAERATGINWFGGLGKSL